MTMVTVQGLRFIMPIIGSLSYTAPSLGLIVQPPGHRSRARPWCRRGRALSCSQRRHTVILSSGVACSAHGEQRGGSVRRLRTRSGDELARSPAMPRPPPSMMPSLRRPCAVSTILQQCSHLPSRRRRTSREPVRNTDLESATEFGLRVLKLRRAQVSRALILSGSSSRRRAREIYVPSRRDLTRSH